MRAHQAWRIQGRPGPIQEEVVGNAAKVNPESAELHKRCKREDYLGWIVQDRGLPLPLVLLDVCSVVCVVERRARGPFSIKGALDGPTLQNSAAGLP